MIIGAVASISGIFSLFGIKISRIASNKSLEDLGFKLDSVFNLASIIL
jgi:hypothetical protein